MIDAAKILVNLAASFSIATKEQIQAVIDDTAPGQERENEPVHRIAKAGLEFKVKLDEVYADFRVEEDMIGAPHETCACGQKAGFWVKHGQVPICEACKDKLFA